MAFIPQHIAEASAPTGGSMPTEDNALPRVDFSGEERAMAEVAKQLEVLGDKSQMPLIPQEIYTAKAKGLQSIANAVGSMFQGFGKFKQANMAARQIRDEHKVKMGYAQVVNGFEEWRAQNPGAPENWVPEFDKRMSDYNESLTTGDLQFSKDNEFAVRSAIEAKYIQGRGTLAIDAARSNVEQAREASELDLQTAVEELNVNGGIAIIDRLHKNSIFSDEERDKAMQGFEEALTERETELIKEESFIFAEQGELEAGLQKIRASQFLDDNDKKVLEIELNKTYKAGQAQRDIRGMIEEGKARKVSRMLREPGPDGFAKNWPDLPEGARESLLEAADNVYLQSIEKPLEEAGRLIAEGEIRTPAAAISFAKEKGLEIDSYFQGILNERMAGGLEASAKRRTKFLSQISEWDPKVDKSGMGKRRILMGMKVSGMAAEEIKDLSAMLLAKENGDAKAINAADANSEFKRRMFGNYVTDGGRVHVSEMTELVDPLTGRPKFVRPATPEELKSGENLITLPGGFGDFVGAWFGGGDIDNVTGGTMVEVDLAWEDQQKVRNKADYNGDKEAYVTDRNRENRQYQDYLNAQEEFKQAVESGKYGSMQEAMDAMGSGAGGIDQKRGREKAKEILGDKAAPGGMKYYGPAGEAPEEPEGAASLMEKAAKQAEEGDNDALAATMKLVDDALKRAGTTMEELPPAEGGSPSPSPSMRPLPTFNTEEIYNSSGGLRSTGQATVGGYSARSGVIPANNAGSIKQFGPPSMHAGGVLQTAMQWEGQHYKQGTPAMCADFISNVMKDSGINMSGKMTTFAYGLNRDEIGTYVPPQGVQPGDLVFFRDTYNATHGREETHVELVTAVDPRTGAVEMIGRNTKGGPVKRKVMNMGDPNDFYGSRVMNARRISGGEGGFGYGQPVRYEGPQNLMKVMQNVEVRQDQHTVRNDIPKNGVNANVRYNNPGAAYPRERDNLYATMGYGIIKDGHKIALFPTPVHGAAANMDLFASKYAGMTLKDALYKWRDGNEGWDNIPKGFDPNMVIDDVFVRNKKMMMMLFMEKAQHEGGNNMPHELWSEAFDMYAAGGHENYLKAKADPMAFPIDADGPGEEPEPRTPTVTYSGDYKPGEEVAGGIVLPEDEEEEQDLTGDLFPQG